MSMKPVPISGTAKHIRRIRSMSASPVTLVGNLTADPKLEFLANGTAKLAFSIACNHYWTDQQGEKQEKTSFFNIVAWRTLAEDGGNTLAKGSKVVVTGRLEQRSYEDKEGNKKSVTEVVADNIGLSVYGVESYQKKEKKDGGSRPSVPTARKPVSRASTQPKLVEPEEPWL
ncbi:MAG: single-stranded DNA-binding protein [Planctomycetes bacterium]|nr:single-stranded DNA-binding protein [Planctomycetota bacterium]